MDDKIEFDAYEVEEHVRVESTDEFVRKYAQVVLDAATIREGSYDHKAAETADKKSEYVDYSNFYKKDIHQAVEEAAIKHNLQKELVYPIYLSLETFWNDISDWAEEQLGIHSEG